MTRFGDVRDLFEGPGGFAPETWSRHGATLVVQGRLPRPGRPPVRIQVIAGAPDRVRKPLRTAAGLAFGLDWARGDLSAPGDLESLDRAVDGVVAAVAGRAAAIAAAVPWRTPSGAFAHGFAETDRSEIPPALVRAAADPAVDELRIHAYLRSECLQACRFCPREDRRTFGPPEWDEDAAFLDRLAREVLRPAALRGAAVSVGFDAHDLAGHGRLRSILESVNRSAGCPMHLVLPGNRVSRPEVAREVATLPGIESLTLTLFGGSEAVHDDVAGRPGAFRETLRALRLLATDRTLRVKAHVVVTTTVLPELPAVAAIARHLGVTPILRALNADSSDHRRLLAPLLPRLDVLRGALGAAATALDAAGAELLDFPICAVPASLRPRARTEHRREEMFEYPDPVPCAACRHHDGCPGVPRAYPDVHGVEGLAPEPA